MRSFLSVLALLTLTTGAMAGPGIRKQTAKLIDVRVCPIMMEPVGGSRPLTLVWSKYRVFFCCSSCKPTFEAKSDKQKLAAIKAALAKQVRK